MDDLEHALINSLKAGDQAAFRELIRLQQNSVYTIALGFVRHPQDAEDIAQEVFIHAFQSIHQFKANSALSTWLHRIAVNKSLDHLRAHKRLKRFGLLVSLFGPDNRLIVDPADPVHPGVLLEDQERANVLFAAVEKLPEAQRVAYILNKIDNMSVKQTADAMNVTVKAAESLLARAKSNLKNVLKHYYEDSLKRDE